MKFAFPALAVAASMVGATAAASQPSDLIRVSSRSYPTDSTINFGDVQGYINVAFGVGIKSSRITEIIDEYLKSNRAFFLGGKSTGTVLIQLEVKAGTNIIVTQPLFTATYTESGFLFKQDSESTNQLSWSKTVANWINITDITNILDVSISATDGSSATADPKLFDIVNNIAVSTLNLANVPASALVTAATSIASQVAPLLDHSSSKSLSSDETMAFILHGSAQNANGVTFLIPADDGGTGIPIRVSLETDTAKAGPYIPGQGFVRPNPSSFYRNATFTADAAEINVFDNIAVLKDTNNPAKALVASMSAGDPYAKDDIGTACEQLYDLLGMYLTSRDQRAAYWAFLNQYYSLLKKNPKAAECVTSLSKATSALFAVDNIPLDKIGF